MVIVKKIVFSKNLIMEKIFQEYQMDVFERHLTDSEFSVTQLESSSIRQALFTGRTLVKAWAKSLNDENRKIKGQAFVQQLISRYWFHHFNDEIKFNSYVAETQLPKIDRTISALANSLALSASVLDVNEACYHIGVMYTLLLSDSERSENGAFYTPPNLVETLFDRINCQDFDLQNKNILDPACGSGVFLTAAASKISKSHPAKNAAVVIAHIEKNLCGWEIDPFAGWMAQTFIEVALKPYLLKTKKHLKPLIQVGNSLDIAITNNQLFDLVIGNPPYGKITLSAELRKQYARSLYGHANLYGLFMDIALSKTRISGFIAYVTPTSFLGGEYFKALRQLYAENTTAVNFDFISTRKGIFEDVLQEAVLSLFQRKKREGDKSCAIHEVESFVDDENCYQTLSTSIGSLKNIAINSNPWILPRSKDQKLIAANIANLKHNLSDWGYEINTGQLVWNRHKEQLKTNPGKGRHNLIWAESISQNGVFTLKPTKSNHVPFIELRKKDGFLLTTEACVLAQRTTSKEQSRRLITAVLPESIAERGVVIENHVNIIRPLEPKVNLKVLSVFLNSRTVDQIFRCLSGSVAVSAYELESIPLPNYSKLNNLKKLIAKNAEASQIEAEILNLYTL